MTNPIQNMTPRYETWMGYDDEPETKQCGGTDQPTEADPEVASAREKEEIARANWLVQTINSWCAESELLNEEVTLAKAGDKKEGAALRVLSASARAGCEVEAKGEVAHGSYTAPFAKVEAELLSARAAIGAMNDDGSVGVNATLMATAAAAEGTLQYSGWSVTLGASLSMGAAVSDGIRDIDRDGSPEQCRRLSIGPVTVGFCTEL